MDRPVRPGRRLDRRTQTLRRADRTGQDGQHERPGTGRIRWVRGHRLVRHPPPVPDHDRGGRGSRSPDRDQGQDDRGSSRQNSPAGRGCRRDPRRGSRTGWGHQQALAAGTRPHAGRRRCRCGTCCQKRSRRTSTGQKGTGRKGSGQAETRRSPRSPKGRRHQLTLATGTRPDAGCRWRGPGRGGGPARGRGRGDCG